ncbi:MAG: hypothetical protein IIB46_02795 [Nitrospinae bacterium]|nr:hypothetical protein [Nitrospinota bacterium]
MKSRAFIGYLVENRCSGLPGCLRELLSGYLADTCQTNGMLQNFPTTWAETLGSAHFTPTGHEGKGRISHALEPQKMFYAVNKLVLRGGAITQAGAGRWR